MLIKLSTQKMIKFVIFLCVVFFSSQSFANQAILTWVSEPEVGVTQINLQRLVDGAWQDVEQVYQSNELNTAPIVGSNHLGEILVVWSSKSVVRSTIRAKLFRNDQWQSVRMIANQGGQSSSPAIVFDQSGNAHVVWVSDEDGLDDIYHSKWQSSSNSWTGIKKINSSNQVPDISPELLFDNGTTVVEWVAFSQDAAAYVDQSSILDDETFNNDSADVGLVKSDLEMNFSDISMPENWQKYRDSTVLHFPNNSLIQYERLSD